MNLLRKRIDKSRAFDLILNTTIIIGIAMLILTAYSPSTVDGIFSSKDTGQTGEIYDPTEGQNITQLVYTVRWYNTDGSTNWAYSLDGGIWKNTDGDNYTRLNSLTLGSHNFKLARYVVFEELTVYSVTDQVNFTVLTLSINITSPSAGTYHTNTITLSWTVTAYGYDAIQTYYSTDWGETWNGGGTVLDPNGQYTFSQTLQLSTGDYRLMVKVDSTYPSDEKIDGVGIRIETEPVLYITSPRNNSVYDQTYMNVRWYAYSGENDVITGFTLYHDSDIYTLTSDIREYNVTGLAYSQHNISLVMHLQNSSDIVKNVTYYLMQQNVTITSPQDNDIVGDNITIRWETEIATDGTFSIRIGKTVGGNISVFDYSPTSSDTNFECEYYFNSSGNYSLQIILHESDGNDYFSEVVSFSVQVSNQTNETETNFIEIEIVSATSYPNGSAYIEWNTTSSIPIKEYHVIYDENDITTTQTFAWIHPKNSYTTVTIKAIDIQGHSNSTSKDITIASEETTTQSNTSTYMAIFTSIVAIGAIGKIYMIKKSKTFF